MTTHDPEDEFSYFDDAGDAGLDALDFDTSSLDDDASGLDALSDYPTDDADQLSGLDAFHDHQDHESSADDTHDFGLDAVDADDAADEDAQVPVVQAVNPPGTVAVTAYLGGSVAHIDLDPKVTALTESQLAEEIRFVAGVAATKASAIVHVGVVNMFVEQGMNLRDARDFVETNMPFATPEQAHEADLALIARHSERED